MKNVLLSAIGTLGFCIILNAPVPRIKWIIGGAVLASTVYEAASAANWDMFAATAAASLACGIYSEIIARTAKTPSTVIFLPASIPLLPGGYLYYAMTNLVKGNAALFRVYLKQTLQGGFGIAFGVILTSAIILNLRRIKSFTY